MKKFIGILCALTLVVSLLAACSNNGTSRQNSSEDNNQSSSRTDGSASSNDNYTDEDDIVEIYMAICDLGQENTQKVEDAVNKITIPEIGVKVNLLYLLFGDIANEQTLRLASGEPLDILQPLGTFSSLYSQGALMEISGLLEEYAPDLLEVVGDGFMKAYQMQDGIYGVPTLRVYCTNDYWIMDKTVLEEHGLLEKAENCSSWSELEAIFEEVYPDLPAGMYITGNNGGILPQANFSWTGDSFSSSVCQESLGDANNLLDVDADGNVINWLTLDSVVSSMQRAAAWNAKGWVWPESAFSGVEPGTDQLFNTDTYFAYHINSEVGVETAKSQLISKPLMAIQSAPGLVRANNLQLLGALIPSTSDEPEAAIRFLNLLYTSPELNTLLAWGIEGEDYVVNEEGEACFPEGSNGVVEYHETDFAQGNQFLVLPWDGAGGDFRAEAKAVNDSSPISRFLGFTIDSSNLEAEIAALAVVSDEFNQQIFSGLYTEDLYNQYMNKLEAAGLSDYIEEVQKQLDAFNN